MSEHSRKYEVAEHRVVLGTTNSGMSYMMKMYILHSLIHSPDIHVFILDPTNHNETKITKDKKEGE